MIQQRDSCCLKAFVCVIYGLTYSRYVIDASGNFFGMDKMYKIKTGCEFGFILREYVDLVVEFLFISCEGFDSWIFPKFVCMSIGVFF